MKHTNELEWTGIWNEVEWSGMWNCNRILLFWTESLHDPWLSDCSCYSVNILYLRATAHSKLQGVAWAKAHDEEAPSRPFQDHFKTISRPKFKTWTLWTFTKWQSLDLHLPIPSPSIRQDLILRILDPAIGAHIAAPYQLLQRCFFFPCNNWWRKIL